MYSEKKKEDRERMAMKVEEVAYKHGATVKKTPEGEDPYSPRRVLLNIETPQGLGLYLAFDGQSSQPNIYVVPWCLRSRSLRLSDDFARYQGAELSYYGNKCMPVKRGFPMLLDAIDMALEMAAKGTAFENGI